MAMELSESSERHVEALRRILRELISDQKLLEELARGREPLLSSVEEQGYQLALFRLPRKPSLTPRQREVAGLVGHGLGINA